MAYEERRVVAEEPLAAEPVETVETVPAPTVVERVPAARRQTVIASDDPVGNAYAASQLIQTIVWAVVVLVLLIVALWALHVYTGMF